MAAGVALPSVQRGHDQSCVEAPADTIPADSARIWGRDGGAQPQTRGAHRRERRGRRISGRDGGARPRARGRAGERGDASSGARLRERRRELEGAPEREERAPKLGRELGGATEGRLCRGELGKRLVVGAEMVVAAGTREAGYRDGRGWGRRRPAFYEFFWIFLFLNVG